MAISPSLRRNRRPRRLLRRIRHLRWRKSGAVLRFIGSAQRTGDTDVPAPRRTDAAENTDADVDVDAATKPIENAGFHRPEPSTTASEKIPTLSKPFHRASGEGVDAGDR